MRAAQRILVYMIKTASLGITYGGSSSNESTVLQAMHASARKDRRWGGGMGLGVAEALSDANWECDGPSVSGHLIMFNAGVLAWTSKKQPSTALSSTEAEIFAAASATAEVLWLRGLLGEMGLVQLLPTTLWVDNSGAVAVAGDAGSIGRSRHIVRRSYFMIEAHRSGAIRARGITGDGQAADVLTKPLPRSRFVMLRDFMMNIVNRVRGREHHGAEDGASAATRSRAATSATNEHAIETDNATLLTPTPTKWIWEFKNSTSKGKCKTDRY
jgi:hypothetical protein